MPGPGKPGPPPAWLLSSSEGEAQQCLGLGNSVGSRVTHASPLCTLPQILVAVGNGFIILSTTAFNLQDQPPRVQPPEAKGVAV